MSSYSMIPYIHKTTGILFVIMLCNTTFFHAGSAQISSPKRLDHKRIKQGCPCPGCIATGIPGKQHPYTDREKLFADAFLRKWPKFCIQSREKFPLISIVLDYYWDEDEYEWITLEAITGFLTIPDQAWRDRNTISRVYMDRVDHVAGRIQESKILLPTGYAQFHGDDIQKLASFCAKSQHKQERAIKSKCGLVKITASHECENGELLIQSTYRLDGFKRIQAYMHHNPDSCCCVIL